MDTFFVQNTIKLIVGLCNPGLKYEKTRHNVGANFVRTLAQQQHCNFLSETKFKGLHTRFQLDTEYCHLLIPTTYMNNSGQAVKALVNFYKLPTSSILIAHDELDLPTGTTKLKHNGGHGGHNGLRDIINQLGSKEFLKLRIGIGRPTQEDVSHYVLNNPSTDEQHLIEAAMEKGLAILPNLFAGEIDQAIKTLHTDKN